MDLTKSVRKTLKESIEEGVYKAIKKNIELYKQIVREEIDRVSLVVIDDIKRQTPVRTGALKNSLTVTRVSTDFRYGYKLWWGGYNSSNVPFQYIANKLNKDFRPFITDNVKRLKAINRNIQSRVQATMGPQG
jgi:hypothetical protein